MKRKTGLPAADVPIDFYSAAELKKYIQTAGKTAQSRLKSLENAYSDRGSLAGRKSYVLEKYGGLNTRTAGLSEKALRLKAEQIRGLLSAKSSTVKGVKEIDAERLKTFKRNHPNYKIQSVDKLGRTRSRQPSRAEWLRAMEILGKIQKAEKGAHYDSNEQLYMAMQLATTPDSGIIPEGQSDSVNADNFLNESGDMLVSSEMFFAKSDVAKTHDFMDVRDYEP